MIERQNPVHQAHLSPEEIVRYIDHTIADGARNRVEVHLADCEACLRDVIESQRVLQGQASAEKDFPPSV